MENAHQEAIIWAVRFGHPHFTLGFDRAYPIVNSLLRHDKHLVANELHQGVWNDIAEQVKALIEISPNITVPKALEFVLDNGRASQFHLTQLQAMRNLRKIKKENTRRLIEKMKNQRPELN